MVSTAQNDAANRCIKCMAEKGGSRKCPHCGYDEAKFKQEALFLRPRTILNGRYLCGLMIGKGGFGITYIGWDIQLHRKLAIKEFFPSALASRHFDQSTVLANSDEDKDYLEQGLRMFLDEARRVAQFHEVPGVVTVHDFFEENNTAYMVMEYLTGSDLHNYLHSHGERLSHQDALALFKPILAALKQVHAAKVYHRDISAQNIIITDQKQLKLIDFGAAKYTVRERSDTVRVVKPGYSPLEQYATQGRIGPWTDVYAVGATLYLLMAGTLPPESPDRLYSDELIPLGEIEGLEVPEYVSQAVLHCLSVKQDDRYQTIEDLEKELYSQQAAGASGSGGPPEQQPPRDTGEGTGPIGPGDEKVAKGGGGSKKTILAVGVMVLLAGLGLGAWLFLGNGGHADQAPPVVSEGRAERQDIKKAQRSLVSLGLYSGPVSGRLDRETRQALEKYQRQKGWPVTGKPDKKVLAGLVADSRKKDKEARQRDALAEARQFLSASQFGKAEEAFKKILAADPQSATAQKGLQETRAAKAESELRQKEAKLLEQAKRTLAKGEYQQASELYSQVLSINPGSEPAQKGQRESNGLLRREEKFAALVHKGRQALEAGNPQEAKEYFEEAEAVKPNTPEARSGLARASELLAAATTTTMATTTTSTMATTTTTMAPVVPKLAMVRVDCQPTAKVFLDGKEVGATPYKSPKIRAREYTIEVRGFGSSDSKRVTLKDRKTRQVLFILKGGTLSVNSAPWAMVYLDGIQLGPTPLLKNNLLLGPHVLEAKKEGYRTEKRNIKLVKGRPVNIRFRLQPVQGE
ncbi:MAG: protein kinase [Desulfarculaceae bacterium]|nr:protein kinase [Desulfarculaceae bacterium]MCF8072140.1 protein kinase [Desulfarculaceae bacterium]MCF8100061.1 protein kinase [Desulfarculaceae bacterium]MCF8118268.1 protein kinase [Desulfarculaceae bacterium]